METLPLSLFLLIWKADKGSGVKTDTPQLVLPLGIVDFQFSHF